jgi:predicted transcriptional regulator
MRGGASGRESRGVQAPEVMTRELVTLTPNMPAAAAAEVLSRADIHGAPVGDWAGRLVGIATVVDLVTQVARTVQDVMARDRSFHD